MSFNTYERRLAAVNKDVDQWAQKISKTNLNNATLETGSDGVSIVDSKVFTSAGSTFDSNGLVAGDILSITSGADQGIYEIESVDSEIQLTLRLALTASAGTLDFEAFHPIGNVILINSVMAQIATRQRKYRGNANGHAYADIDAMIDELFNLMKPIKSVRCGASPLTLQFLELDDNLTFDWSVPVPLVAGEITVDSLIWAVKRSDNADLVSDDFQLNF